ncbi:hypothetical protein BDM02DRAFT_3132575 [Thelephora ganbajun]|uniref:Uncharacterized protein n=1 Tax=Thelephora ganbajun TaxID=370292 RepID=A0ACB6Z196_THEGA|nr:hypothetical protein BDM02DRAFT_3132575 [Thelephora ganbajun]
MTAADPSAPRPAPAPASEPSSPPTPDPTRNNDLQGGPNDHYGPQREDPGRKPGSGLDEPGVDDVVLGLEKVCLEENLGLGGKMTNEVVPETLAERLEWIQKNIAFLGPEIDQMNEEIKDNIMECIGRLGLTQILYEIGKVKAEGHTIDQEFWKPHILEALKTKQDLVRSYVAWKITNLEEDKMDTHPDNAEPVPIPAYVPLSPVNWYPDINVAPYVPQTPLPNGAKPPYVPRLPETEELDLIKARVLELEDTVDEKNKELEWQIKRLNDQTFLDGCKLMELKWKHGYNMCYATTLTDQKLTETRMEIVRMGERIEELEKRIVMAENEITGIQNKMTEVLNLAPRIEELAKRVEAERKLQTDTNSVLLSEVAVIKHTIKPALKAQIKQQASKIMSLNERYQQLYGYAMQTLYPTQASGFHGRNSYTSYPISDHLYHKTVSAY